MLLSRTTVAKAILAVGTVVIASGPLATAGSAFDGQGEFQTGDYGYYYAITGGKFPTGNAINGDNASGGTFRFLHDDPAWGRNPAELQNWVKDDWFQENAGLALTLKNAGTIVYDNNGIEDGSYGSYYDATGLDNSASKPGLYRAYSMSNNFDWIYAGYFRIDKTTTVDTILGYYDENAGFDSDSPSIRFDMNIWSAFQPDPTVSPNTWMPVNTGGFAGDIFAAADSAGTFSWGDTGVNRVFGSDLGNATDDIFRLEFNLETPLVLQPGVYFFSHDAEIVPTPSAAAGGVFLMAGLGLRRRRRRRHA